MSAQDKQTILDVAEECYYTWLGMSKKEQSEVCRMNGTRRNTFYQKFIVPIIHHAHGVEHTYGQCVLSYC